MVLACLLPLAVARATDTLSIAAAANLVYTLEDLDAAFRQENPGGVVAVATGASRNLVAQITHGAPYDLFLSADLDYP